MFQGSCIVCLVTFGPEHVAEMKGYDLKVWSSSIPTAGYM